MAGKCELLGVYKVEERLVDYERSLFMEVESEDGVESEKLEGRGKESPICDDEAGG